ncbi:MAG: Rrf2 family transcriptional regulator [Actinobacteria bacterium HGW-Actinobacteria-6]|jgi:Rrf2 family protein|nr:MAG: Rrf2 family transcriptional regulator [Actinobacteria bacterium HGW-Actinobacteria-6]
MRLTARSEYGLLALVEIASGGDSPRSVRDLSERWELPAKFLEQLLAALKRAGILHSIRGAHGGYVLARPASQISALEIVEALEGPIAPSMCDRESPGCAQSAHCAAGAVWGRVSDAVRGVLASATLEDIAGNQQRLDATAPKSEE